MDQVTRSTKQIGTFILYTFLISWLSWSIIIVGNTYFDALWYGQPLFWIPMLIGGLGPAISVFIIYRKSKQEFKEKSFLRFVFYQKLDRRAWLIFIAYLVWRFSMVWFAFGISEPIAIIYLFINLPLFVLGGGFEEIGWRGYLQPLLEKRTNYIVSVLLVGVIWGIWHLPLWLIIGTVQSALPFGLYMLLAIILSVTFTAIYKYTKSILLCVLSHAWFNGCIGLAVYIGSSGYLQLNLSWKVFLVFTIEFVVSLILAIRIVSQRKKSNFASIGEPIESN